jgi:hypothetical protein
MVGTQASVKRPDKGRSERSARHFNVCSDKEKMVGTQASVKRPDKGRSERSARHFIQKG